MFPQDRMLGTVESWVEIWKQLPLVLTIVLPFAMNFTRCVSAWLFTLVTGIPITSAQQPLSSIPSAPTYTPLSPPQPFGTEGSVLKWRQEQEHLRILEQNRSIMLRLGYPQPPTQEQIRSNAVAHGQRAASGEAAMERNGVPSETGVIGMPSNSYTGRFRFVDLERSITPLQRQAYVDAATQLIAMLEGREPLSVRTAILISERPVMGSDLSEGEYRHALSRTAGLVRQYLRQEGMDPADPLARHYGIQKLFQDTVLDRRTGEWKPPYRYDLEDYYGADDPRKVTVGKLLITNEGQCRSMPLLYLAIAEELNTEAFLAFSPNHSYVKFRDPRGTFHNFETTVGRLTSDAWIIASGYVRTEAVRSHVYIDTVGTHRIVAHLLAELALSFSDRFGYDPEFMGHCLREALKHYPNDIHAWQLLANVATARFDRTWHAFGRPPREQWNRFPAIVREFEGMHQVYAHIDRLGYADMPREAYEAWLRSLEAERERRAEEERKRLLFSMPDLKR